MANFKYQLYYGAALLKIIQDQRCLGVSDYVDDDNSSFKILSQLRESGLYVKYTESRLIPWSFTFSENHLEKLLELKSKFEKVFVLLVCYDAGVCCLNYDEIERLLRPSQSGVKSISVSKRNREKYSVHGTNGELKYKIGDNDFPEKIFNPICFEK
ncbi:MAG: hypothetical protein WCP14_01930 [bacterium]